MNEKIYKSRFGLGIERIEENGYYCIYLETSRNKDKARLFTKAEIKEMIEDLKALRI